MISLDRAKGAVVGALCGDVCGAPLEMLGRLPSYQEVEEALTMINGGGIHRVAPGQITDDGELTLCQLHGLVDFIQTENYDSIANMYQQWYFSKPFDCGNTTRTAFRVHHDSNTGISLTQTMKLAAMRNRGSKANGSLMRATPIGVWGAGKDKNYVAEIAKLDSSLSHPNQTCQDAVACYVLAIAYLVEGLSRQETFAKIKEWAKQNANEEVNEWLHLAEMHDIPAATPSEGFVKIAFVYAFFHLICDHDYVTAIQHTLIKGGDTDTNACIVGGLIGAAVGVSKIPYYMTTALFECEPNHNRPRFLHPIALHNLFYLLFQK